MGGSGGGGGGRTALRRLTSGPSCGEQKGLEHTDKRWKTGKSNTQLISSRKEVAAAPPGMPGMMQVYNLVILGYLLRQALPLLPGFTFLLVQDLFA